VEKRVNANTTPVNPIHNFFIFVLSLKWLIWEIFLPSDIL